ncbi:multiprotein-bridging factor 1 family protein [Actinomadura yumaensis]|uniref:helix-turn-helix domain-containing protein n=1 Tax=Actinomadura yumaensis TaxID=111807 RepID=UPI0036073652
MRDERMESGPDVGARIRYFRERRGMSREVLGGLVGRSGRWVKAVERGRSGSPSFRCCSASPKR